MATKTIADLINEIDATPSVANNTVKTASAGAGAGNNTPVSSEGASMGLMEMYQQEFGGNSQAMPKVASAQVQQPAVMQKTAQERKLEKLGSVSRNAFDVSLDEYLFKFAAEDIASREADASGTTVGDPQLPVNRPMDAAAPINTTPVYHDEQYRAPTAAQEQLIAEITDVVNAQTHGGSLVTTQEHPTAQVG
jgi:hypothetical protein